MRLVPRNARNINPLGMGLPLWLSLTVSTGALAQAASQPSAEGTVEDVVVSAPQQTITEQQLEKVQSTPVTATVVTQQQLEAAQINDLQAAQKLEPSLNIKFSNVRNIAINVRGFGASSSSATDAIFGGSPVYLNGVYQPFVGQAVFDIPDLVGIEVLKGPQGTVGGMDNTGGVINITTAAPSFTLGQSYEFQYGSYNMFQEKGSVTGPINGTDWAAFRLSFFDKDQEGYVRSTSDGNKYMGTHDKGGMAQILLTPESNLTALITASYSTVTQAQNVAGFAGVMTNYTNGTAVSNNFYTRAAKIGATVPSAGQFLSTYTTPGQGWQNTAQDSYQLSAKVDYTFNGFTIDSVTSGIAWDFHPHNGFSTTPGTAYVVGTGSQIDAKSFTEDIKISNPTGGPVNATAGLFFLESLLVDHGLTLNGPNSGAFSGASSYAGLTAAQTAAVNNVALNYLSRQAYDNPRTTEIAPYIQDVWHATSNFDITTGLRYSYVYKTSYFSQYESNAQPIPASFTATQVADVNAARITAHGAATSWYASTHQGILSALATATYKFTPDVFGYATVSQGGRSGGPNPATNLPDGTPKTVKAEQLNNFEVGLKSSWFDQKLTANLATFVMIDRNYIATGASYVGTTVSTYLTNAKRAESRGVEIDLRAKPVEGLSLYSSLTYDDAFYASFKNSSCPPEVTGQSVCDLTGKPLANTPKWTVVVGGEYSHNVGNLLATVGIDKPVVAYAGADFTWQSSYYSDQSGATNDSIYAIINPYGLLDLHAGIKFVDNSWDLVAWAHNALDKHYYTAKGVASGTGGEIVGYVGEPLMVGVTLRAKF